MQFYPPNPRRRPIPPVYRQRVAPPSQIQRQDDSLYYLNQVRRQDEPFLPPNNQPQVSRLRRFPDHLNTIYGHMGTIRNGVDMMRQLGAFLSRFR
ncbi:hypothetical protein U5N28_11745 [Lysinibacillus telephonicus]|uniref:YppG-like protein n=1 Tax=Lysinibacillus telephonicus TaxID=1714840 RepID=A0A431UDN4_9BACI|nr:hypothetical protein [Lysinibacillus telephonicus]RTQ87526.1 hypothetical protein EKG35_18990 [Lysinibacillus telephonicus]